MPLLQNIHEKEDTRMSKNNQTVFIAKTLSDVFYHVNSVSGLQIVGGCTFTNTIDEKSLTIRNIPDLSGFEKRERYIDFGPGVTLSQMLSIGRNKMPSILYDAISTVATPAVRNLATLGGNICAGTYSDNAIPPVLSNSSISIGSTSLTDTEVVIEGNYAEQFMQGQKLTLYAPLLALDARLELRSQNETRYIPFSKFRGVPHGFVLTKIRVSFDEWEVALFKRVGPKNQISPLSAGFVFLANTQKDILMNIRIAFAGPLVFRSQELENKVIGTRLPLSEHTIQTLIDEANVIYDSEVIYQKPKPIFKAQFLNLLRYSLEQLT